MPTYQTTSPTLSSPKTANRYILLTTMTKKPVDLDDIAGSIADLTQMFSARFDAMDARMFRMEQKQLEHDKRFDEIDKKIDHIYSLLDNHLKRIEDMFADNVARDHQQARMEKWIFQIADKLDLKLKYE